MKILIAVIGVLAMAVLACGPSGAPVDSDGFHTAPEGTHMICAGYWEGKAQTVSGPDGLRRTKAAEGRKCWVFDSQDEAVAHRNSIIEQME